MNPCGGMISYNPSKFWLKKHGQRELTELTLLITLGKLCVRSTQGLISTAPAGRGKSRSRKSVRREIANPAPAESPAITIFDGSTGLCNAEGGGLVRYKSAMAKH